MELAAFVHFPLRWVFFVIVAVAVLVIVWTALRSRKFMAESGLKICAACATPNPMQAQFCRKCGKRLSP